jgi:phospholipase/carboxylesterase
MDGSTEAQAAGSMAASAVLLNAFLDKVLADEGLAPENLGLLGFSQGTMMSLHVAPRRPAALGAVVGFSGRLIDPERLAAETRSTPPVLLLHGDRDDIVPPSSMPDAADALQAAGFETYTHVMQGTAHGIAPDGLSLALSFLQEKLGRD